jgi:hypothetical protein
VVARRLLQARRAQFLQARRAQLLHAALAVAAVAAETLEVFPLRLQPTPVPRLRNTARRSPS